MAPMEGLDEFLDELPNVDRQSCRLLGPTALVRPPTRRGRGRMRTLVGTLRQPIPAALLAYSHRE